MLITSAGGTARSLFAPVFGMADVFRFMVYYEGLWEAAYNLALNGYG